MIELIHLVNLIHLIFIYHHSHIAVADLGEGRGGPEFPRIIFRPN